MRLPSQTSADNNLMRWLANDEGPETLVQVDDYINHRRQQRRQYGGLERAQHFKPRHHQVLIELAHLKVN